MIPLLLALQAPALPAGKLPTGSVGATMEACVGHAPPGKSIPEVALVPQAAGPTMAGAATTFALRAADGSQATWDGSRAAYKAREAALLEAHLGIVWSASRILVADSTLTLVPLPTRAGAQQLSIPALPVTVRYADGSFGASCTQAFAWSITDPTEGVPDAKPKFRSLFVLGREHDAVPLAYLALFLLTVATATAASRARTLAGTQRSAPEKSLAESIQSLLAQVSTASRSELHVLAEKGAIEMRRALPRGDFPLLDPTCATFRVLATHAQNQPLRASLVTCADAEDHARFAGEFPIEDHRGAVARFLESGLQVITAVTPQRLATAQGGAANPAKEVGA